jgi:hypothetical protein
MGGPSAWGLGDKLTTPHLKKGACYELLTQSIIDGKILLRRIFRKLNVRKWTGSS